MSKDDSYLDAHDDQVLAEAHHWNKVDNITGPNDPLDAKLTALENQTMLPAHQYLDALESHIESNPHIDPTPPVDSWNAPGPPPITKDPAVIDRTVLQPRSPDPVDPTLSSKGHFWREPRYEPLGKSVSGKSYRDPYLPKYTPKSRDMPKTRCPEENDEEVLKVRCVDCKHRSDSSLRCRLKDEEANALAGKKGGKR
jgi:hypothetical protein